MHTCRSDVPPHCAQCHSHCHTASASGPGCHWQCWILLWQQLHSYARTATQAALYLSLYHYMYRQYCQCRCTTAPSVSDPVSISILKIYS